jgi:hypothetical protein
MQQRSHGFQNKTGPNLRCPRPFVATCGEVFADGATINLIRDSGTNQLKLLLSTAKAQKIAGVVEYGGRTYTPARFEASVRSALSLPTRCGQFGSLFKLFCSLRNLFFNRGFPADAVFAVPYFVFATWVLDALPAAPTLIIRGPRAEAELLLHLLGCTLRFPLALGQVTRETLCGLPMGFHASILIEQSRITSSTWAVLKASNHRGVYVPWNQGLCDPFFAKVFILEGKDVDAEFRLGDYVVPIDLPPMHGSFPILTDTERKAIAEEFQTKLLAYRCKNIRRVRDSNSDFPHFDSSVRVLGRILAAPMVDAPELQADLEPLLRSYHEDRLSGRELDTLCVTLEALLHVCHRDLTDGRIFVHQISDIANVILKGRDTSASLAPEQTGRIVRKLGFVLKRNAQGSSLFLDRPTRLRIHELARRFRVAASRVGVKTCPICESVFADDPDDGSKKVVM